MNQLTGTCDTNLAPDDQSDADRRQGQRFMTILRVGKLVTETSQQLCLIRNISSGGLMAHVYAPHKVGDKVEIELKSEERLAGEVVWVRHDTVGVRFDGAIEVNDILTHTRSPGEPKARAPRLEVHGRARIKVGDVIHHVEIRDLSQGGIKVKIDEQLHIGEDAVITVEGMEPVKGVVRWSLSGHAGLSFIRAIPFDALISWLDTKTAQRNEA